MYIYALVLEQEKKIIRGRENFDWGREVGAEGREVGTKGEGSGDQVPPVHPLNMTSVASTNTNT